MQDVSHRTICFVGTGAPVYIPHLNFCFIFWQSGHISDCCGFHWHNVNVNVDLCHLLFYKFCTLHFDGGVIYPDINWETICIASFFHQSFCLFQVKIVWSLFCIVHDRIGEDGGWFYCVTLEYYLAECFAVECIVHSLTNSYIVKWFSAIFQCVVLVQGNVTICNTFFIHNLNVRIAFDFFYLDWWNRVDNVCFTSLQHSDTSAIFWNYFKGQGINLWTFSPVVFVANHLGVTAVYTLREDVWTGTCGLFCQTVFTKLFDCFWADDSNLSQFVEEGVVWLVQGNGQLIFAVCYCAYPGFCLRINSQGFVCLTAFPVCNNCFSVEWFTIMEGDSFIQNEGIALTIFRHCPLFCQHWNDVGVCIKSNQRLIHCVGYGIGNTVAGYMWVQMSCVCLHCNNQIIVWGFCGGGFCGCFFFCFFLSCLCWSFGICGTLITTSARAACSKSKCHHYSQQKR